MEKMNQTNMKGNQPRTVSIKAKLLGVIIPVVVIMIFVLILVAYNVSAGIIKQSSKELLSSSVRGQASKIEAWLNENIASFQMAKTAIEHAHPDSAELQTILDGYYNYNSNYPDGLYIADADGRLITAGGSDKTESNPLDSTWYKEGLTRINMGVTSSYTNSNGESVISASGILNDGSGQISVISADMTLDRITIFVNSFIGMKGAEAFLVDSTDKTILAHRDSARISTVLGAEGQSRFEQEVADKISNQDYTFDTLSGNMTGFEQIGGTNWILVSYIPTSLVLKDLSALRIILIVISAVALAMLCVLIERVVHIVIRPVKTMTQTITAMADGDFTVSVDAKGNDEIAVMGHGVQSFISSMRQMLSSTENISQKLEGEAHTCDAVSREMNEAAAVQTKSMSELTLTVDQLSLSVNEIASNATKLACVVADTKENSSAVEEKMHQTVEISEKGRRDMERVGEALESIGVSIQNLESAVNKVGSASSEIVQIIQLIGNIADETNLLSLNASIEAARAGEAGRGFAVVATQIGKLAQDSANSVGHITELIVEINRLVEDAVQQAGASASDIGGSAELIQTAVETFNTIYQNILDTSDLISSVVAQIDQVDSVATSVAAISEEQAASSDEILATSEHMLEQAKNITANSEQVAAASGDLTSSSEQLVGQVRQFQI